MLTFAFVLPPPGLRIKGTCNSSTEWSFRVGPATALFGTAPFGPGDAFSGGDPVCDGGALKQPRVEKRGPGKMQDATRVHLNH